MIMKSYQLLIKTIYPHISKTSRLDADKELNYPAMIVYLDCQTYEGISNVKKKHELAD